MGTQYGIPARGGLHANLVCATSFQLDFKPRSFGPYPNSPINGVPVERRYGRLSRSNRSVAGSIPKAW